MNARSIITSCNTSCANFSHAKYLWLLMMAFEGDTTSIIMNKKASLRMQVVHLYERRQEFAYASGTPKSIGLSSLTNLGWL